MTLGSDSRHLYVFYLTAGLVEVFRLDPPVPGLLLIGHTTDVSTVRWSRDGTQLVSISKDDHSARIWTRANATSHVLQKGNNSDFVDADFDPDGSRVVMVDEVGVVSVHTVQAAGARVQTFGLHPGIDPLFQDNLDFISSTFAVAWSPDGNGIASLGALHKSIGVWKVADGSVQSIATGFDASTVTHSADPSWSADSQHVVTVVVPETGLVVVVLVSVQDGSLQQLPVPVRAFSELEKCTVAFSPDSSTIAAGGAGELHVWRNGSAGQWGEPELLATHVGIRSIAW